MCLVYVDAFLISLSCVISTPGRCGLITFFVLFVDAPSFSKRAKLICDFRHLNIPIKLFPVLVINYEPRQRE